MTEENNVITFNLKILPRKKKKIGKRQGTGLNGSIKLLQLASVVQRLDSAIHWINHYPLDKYNENLLSYSVNSDSSAG